MQVDIAFKEALTPQTHPSVETAGVSVLFIDHVRYLQAMRAIYGER